MGKIDNIVGDLSDFASDFFSRSQVQLDSFSGVSLKDAEYGRIRLDGSFFLREQAGARERCNDDNSEKEVNGVSYRLVLGHFRAICEQIMIRPMHYQEVSNRAEFIRVGS